MNESADISKQMSDILLDNRLDASRSEFLSESLRSNSKKYSETVVINGS